MRQIFIIDWRGFGGFDRQLGRSWHNGIRSFFPCGQGFKTATVILRLPCRYLGGAAKVEDRGRLAQRKLLAPHALKDRNFEIGSVVLAAPLQAGITVDAIGLNPAAEQGGIHLEPGCNKPEAAAALQEGLDDRQLKLMGVLDHVGCP